MKSRYLKADFENARPPTSVFRYIVFILCSLFGVWYFFNFPLNKPTKNAYEDSARPTVVSDARARFENMQAEAKSASERLNLGKLGGFHQKPLISAPLKPSIENTSQKRVPTSPPRLSTKWAKETKPQLRDFSRWADEYGNASPAERAQLKQKGVELAQARRETMAQLISSDPEQALAVAVPARIELQLPEEIRLLLEKRISGVGNLELFGITQAPDASIKLPSVQRFAQFGNERYRASVYGRLAASLSREKISMHGIAVGDQAALMDSPIRLIEPGEELDPDKTIIAKNHPINRMLANRNLGSDSLPLFAESGNNIYCLHCAGNDWNTLMNVVEGGEFASSNESNNNQIAGAVGRAWNNLGTDKKLLVILVDFSDKTGGTVSQSTAQTRCSEINTFYQANSHGNFAFGTRDVTPILRMPSPSSHYVNNNDHVQLAVDAANAAGIAGYNANNYQFVVIAFKYLSFSGSWAGWGTIGQASGYPFSVSWLNGSSMDSRVFAHELGHNLGMWHAASWNPTSTTQADGSSGTLVEYGNDFDVMGNTWNYSLTKIPFTVHYKNLLDWVPNSNIKVVTGNYSGRIYASDRTQLTGRNYAIRIDSDRSLGGKSNLDYWIEYRSLITENSYSQNGAMIYLSDSDGTGAQDDSTCRLLDMRPNTSTETDAPLLNGSTFTDANNRWKIQVTGKGGTGANSYLDIAVTDINLPTISTHPSPASIVSGANHTLTVSASGGSLSYQWRKNGSDISGATSSSYTILSFGLSHEGNYDVRVSNSTGSVYSESVVLFVKPASVSSSAGSENFSGTTRDSTNWGPSDFTRGAGRFVRNGQLKYYTTGSTTVSDYSLHKWHPQSLPYNENWAVQTDVNLPSLTMSPDSSISIGLFLMNQADPDDNAGLGLARAESAGSTSQYFIGALDVNDVGVINQTASNSTTSAAVRYRWDSATETLHFEYDANGATGGYSWTILRSVVLNTGSTNWGMNSSSAFIISGLGLSSNITVSTGNSVWLDDFTITGYPPSITTHPSSQSISAGNNVTFSVVGSGTGLNYQWQKDSSNIGGATSSSYTISGVDSDDNGTYRCVVSNTAGSVNSNGATLTVYIVPAITSHPSDSNSTVGSNITLSVNATGGIPITYQWQKNGVNIRDANSSSYTITGTHIDQPAIGGIPGETKYWQGKLDELRVYNRDLNASEIKNLSETLVVPITAQGYTAGQKVWEFATGGDVRSSPAIGSDGTVYVGSLDNKLYAINPDGTKKWEFVTGDDVTGDPAIGPDGTIYFGSYDRKVYALDSNGTKKWDYTTGSGVRTPAIGSDGTIYVASDKKIYAFDKNGTKKWEFEAANAIHRGPSLSVDGTIYFGTSNSNLGNDSRVYALDSNGIKKWEFIAGSHVHSAPAIAPDGTVYVGSHYKVYALDGESGIKKWEFDSSGTSPYSSPAIGADGSIYFGTSGTRMVSLDANGTKKWHFATSGIVFGAPAIGPDGTIYFGSMDHRIYALDSNGTKKWELITGGDVRSQPAIGSDGTVYIGSDDNKLYAVASSSLGLAQSPWPKFRQNNRNTGRNNGKILLANYLFSGGANDYSGHENNGTVSGALLTTDKNSTSNQAYIFDGTNDIITIGSNGFPHGNRSRTIAGWIKADANSSGEDTLFFYGQKSTGKGFVMGLDSSGNLEVSSYGANAIDANMTVRDGNWHHVGFTSDGNGTAKLYVDGQLAGQSNSWNVDTRTYSPGTYRCIVTNPYGKVTSNGAVVDAYTVPPSISAHPQDVNATTGAIVTLSATAGGTPPFSYQWQKDGANISGATSSSYTLANVQGDNNGTYRIVVSSPHGNSTTSNGAQLGVSLPSNLSQFNNGLMGFWAFTGNANDGSGRNNHATIVGGASYSVDRYGTAGRSLQLDGVDDYTSITSMSDFNFDANKSFTLSAWVNPTDINATSWILSNRNSDGNETYYQFGFDQNRLTTQSNPLLGSGSELHKGPILARVIGASAGHRHSFYILDGGSLWATGENRNGKLGYGSGSDRTIPVKIVDSGVKMAVAGREHSLMIKTDGSLWIWGSNSYGQVSGGSGGQYNFPYKRFDNNIISATLNTRNGYNTTHYVKVDGSADSQGQGGWRGSASGNIRYAAGGDHQLLIKSNGSLWTHGKNQWGQLGIGNNNNMYNHVEVVSSGVVKADGGLGYSLLLKDDGSIWSMGKSNVGINGGNTPGQLITSGVTTMSAGEYHSLYVKTDGSLWGTGSNYYGQLGDGTTVDKASPTKIQNDGVKDVAAGTNHSLILKKNGQLWGAGLNQWGELGDGTTIQRHSPVYITGNTWNQANNWNHITLIFNREHNATHGLIRRYVNGTHYSDLNMTSPAGTLTGSHLFFGAGADLNASQFFSGKLDDIRIYNRSLSPEEVKHLRKLELGRPSILSPPISLAVNADANATFNVTAADADSYQWQKNNANISGETNSTLSLTSVSFSDSGNYRVLVTNASGTTTSGNATLTVYAPPSISTHPADSNSTVGSNITFSVSAAGTAPLSYQWQKNGSNVAGDSNSSGYTIPSLDSDDNGTYRVIVSNPHGNATSNGALLNVGTVPSITTQPLSQYIITGNNVTFSVVSSGTTPFSYQWQKNGSNIPSATSSSYTIGSVSNGDIATYRCVVSNAFGSATSSGAVLNVGAAPSISSHPVDTNATIDSNATFSVTSTGSAPLSFQWQKNGVNINDTNASSYFKSGLAGDDNGTYRVIISNNYGTATSNGAELKVGYGLVKWEFATGGNVTSSPAIGADGTIYFGSNDNKLYALDSNGTKKWEFATGGSVGSSPAIGSDGTIYFGSFDNKLYALDSNGTKKWEFTTGGDVWSSPAIGSDGIIYFGSKSPDNKLYALESNGTKKWEFATGASVSSSPAILSDTTIYFGSTDGKVYALDSNGTKKWEYLTGGGPHGVQSSPAIGADGTIYVGGWDKNVHALDSNGTKKWEFVTGGDVFSSPAIGTDGTIYIGSGDGKIYALDSNGSKKWEFGSAGGDSSPTIGSDGIIYKSGGSKVYALDSNGSKKWEFAMADYSSSSSPAIGTDGTVYVGSNDNKLYALTSGSTGLANSPWPKFHQNNRNTGLSPVPAISTHPADSNSTVGSNVTFSVTATGTAPFSYQWQKGGANIAGDSNSSSYTINSLTEDSNGTYRVVVSARHGNATSNGAVLKVGYAPSITTQPVSQFIVGGNSVTFSVVPSGTTPFSYQWQKNGVNIDGNNTSSYTINTVAGSDAATYRCVASNGFGSATSNGAVLSVGVAPTVTTHPVDTNATVGNNATFSISASGTAPLSYQWQKDGSNVAGDSNSSSYTISSVTGDDNGTYRVVISNLYGTANSNGAELGVGSAPTITSQPSGADQVAGTSVTFTVVSSGIAPITYQWQKNGSNILGATSASYNIGSISSGDAATYRCVVSNSFGSITSNNATLTVGIAPTFSAHPSDSNSTVGSNITFSITAAGTAPLSYQWQKDGSNVAGDSNSSSYTISSLAEDDNGTYRAVVSNAYGTANSNGAALKVGYAPAVTAHPTDQFIVAGNSVTFSLTATGTAVLTYQWQKDGVDISGANSSSYNIASTVRADAATYRCVIGNGFGSATSNGATLTLGIVPLITTEPLDSNSTVRSTVTFSIVSEGTAPLSYEWEKDGVAIADTNSSSYTISKANLTHIGNYTVVVSNLYGTDTSRTTALDVGYAPTIYAQPESGNLNAGENKLFISAAEGSETMTLQWQKDGVDISGAKGAKIVRYYKQYDSAELKWYKDSDNNWCHTTREGVLNRQKISSSGGKFQVSNESYNCGVVYWNNPWQLLGLNFFAVNGVQSSDAGSYTFNAVNRFGSDTSKAAVLTVKSPPVITTHPAGRSVIAGNLMWFTVAASGTGLSYQWQKNGANIEDANSTTYTIASPAAGDAGTYRCVVSNTHGDTPTSDAKLIVLLPPTITINPLNVSASSGGNITFSVAASGPAPLTYQWQKDGANIVSPQNVMISQHLQKFDSAQYKWLKDAEGNWCRLNSDGNLYRQRLVSNGTGGVRIQAEIYNCGVAFWGNPRALVGCSIYAINGVASGDAGSYKCVVSNTIGSTSSTAATLTIE